jgi:CotH kinase protein/Bacterial Ig-like domain (group 3)
MKSNRYNAVATYALLTIGIFGPIPVCHAQTFSLTASPSALTIYPGQQNVAVVVTAKSSTYTGPIAVTLSGLPSGITVSPLSLTAGSSGTLTLNASVSAGQEGFLPTGPSMQTSWTSPVTVVGLAGSQQTTSQMSVTVSISNPSFAPAASAIDLPIVNVNTNGVQIVDKTTEVPGTITITSADGQTAYLPNASDSDNTGTFHLHGHSTTLMPKLAYHIKLTTSLDLLNVMGLQCPYVTDTKSNPTCDKSKSYVLLANYDDKTLLRDWSASALANAIPIGNGYLSEPADSPSPSGTSVLMPWASHSLFVELYLNGVYEGNYQLIEEVKVDSHRVNIDELAETDTTATEVTGGYLMEIDQYQDEAYVFHTPQNLPIGLIDPDFSPDPEVPEQTAYISSYVDAAETALFSSNFTDPTKGWRAYFDEASAINFYIVNDVMGNVDGGDFYSSDYLYKNDNNPLIYMGPVWDFDISSGNVNYAPIAEAILPWMQVNAVWYAQWFQDPGFRADVATQWNTLKKNGVFTAWLASIQQQAATLQQSQLNNFGRWPMQGIEVWPNPQAAGSYSGEVAYFLNWLNLRIGYLDSIFNNKTGTSVSLNTPTGAPRSGSAVTLTAKVSGGNNPTGIVSFLASGLLVGVGSLNGGTATATVNNLPAGMQSLQAVYNGDNTNALSFSAFQSVNVGAEPASSVAILSGPSNGSFTASVIANSGAAIPSGSITFSVDSQANVSVALDADGHATYALSRIALGTHIVNCTYSGDVNYAPSSCTPITIENSAPVSFRK